MISHADYIEILGQCAGPAVIGISVAALRHARKGTTQGIFTGCLTSALVSILTGCLLDLCELPATAAFGIIGLAGYCGGSLLDAAAWRLEKEVKTARLPILNSKESPDAGDAD